MLTDSHVHIVGDDARWPQARTRTYRAGPATLDMLRACAKPSGVERFVIVQPSFYGDDNALLIETLAALGDAGRAVAVIDPARIDDDGARALAQHGVRGFRLNLYSPTALPGGTDAQTMARALAQRAYVIDGHLETLAPLAQMRAHFALLAQMTTPVVLDHYGLFGAATPDDEDGAALLALMRRPHMWMKLSAPYRSGADGHRIEPHGDWLRALLHAAPDRCVWGSDWPHTPAHEDQHGPDRLTPYRPLDYAAQYDAFVAALPSPDALRRVMIDNPARLYGWSP